MSNLLKAADLPDLIPIDFDGIDSAGVEFSQGKAKDSESPLSGPRDSADAAPVEEEVDPLVELERMMQERLLEVERRAQHVEKDAYEKGYAQGEKDGLEYGRRSMEVIADNLNRVLNGIEQAASKTFEDYRAWFIETCLAVSRRVVRRELETSLEPLKATIRALLEEAEEGHSSVLHLNPRDLDLLGKTATLAKWLKDSPASITLRPDPGLERGGCRLENDVQLLDASIETRFALLEKALRGYEPEAESDA